jgi:hypothetical protein
MPATHNGPGSIDLDGSYFWEYSTGHAELRKRQRSNGDLEQIINLDGRLTGLWAVCWDSGRSCFWGTNPEHHGWEAAQCNLIKIGLNGEVIQAVRVSDNLSKPPLIIRDIDLNTDYTYTDAEGNKITPGLLRTADWHYSLRKADFINPDNGFWEEFWFRLSDIQHAGLTQSGSKYYASCDGDNPIGGQYPIIEYDQVSRKAWAPKTGRKIIVPGVWFSSLKVSGRVLWGRGISKDGITKIYLISLGEI